MRRGKLHYNADRWFAYCADRMGWQIGHWINATKADDADRPPTAGPTVDRDAASSGTPSVWRRRK